MKIEAVETRVKSLKLKHRREWTTELLQHYTVTSHIGVELTLHRLIEFGYEGFRFRTIDTNHTIDVLYYNDGVCLDNVPIRKLYSVMLSGCLKSPMLNEEIEKVKQLAKRMR